MRVTLSAALLTISFLVWSVPAVSQERSFLCKFTSGPRAGEIQDYTGHPHGALPVGTSCQDGMGSWGVIVSSRGGGGQGSSSGGRSASCRSPSTEEDCDKCSSDRAYERCLAKIDGD